MGARRRGFALILALVTASMVFGLGVRASTASRSAMIEAGAQRKMADRMRVARSAASIAVSSIASLAASPGVEPTVDAGRNSGVTESFDEPQIPDMPPAMRQLLGQLEDEGGDSESQLQFNDRIESRPARRSLLDSIRSAGLPAGALEFECLGAPVTVRIVDAAGLLNVNRAHEGELASLARNCGIDESRARRLAAEIVDYRDEDDFVSRGGAEAPAYERRGIAIANADIVALEELLFLPSMTRADFDRIEPFLTTVGAGRVHAPTAPREIIAAVDSMTPSAVDRLLAARNSGDLDEQTLARSLQPMSVGALERFTMQSSGYLRVYVSRPGETAVMRVDLVVGDVGGVRFAHVGPR